MKTRVMLMMLVAVAISFAQPAMNQRRGFEKDEEGFGSCPYGQRAQHSNRMWQGSRFNQPNFNRWEGMRFSPQSHRPMMQRRFNPYDSQRFSDDSGRRGGYSQDRQFQGKRPAANAFYPNNKGQNMRGGGGYNSGYCPYNTQPRIYGMSERAQKYAPPASITGEQRGMRRKSEADNKGKDATGDRNPRWQRTKSQPQAGGDGLELKLKLRGAIMEKDYDQAKRIIDKLA